MSVSSIKVLTVLGAPNSDCGALSNIAIERCDKALELISNEANTRLILTGGFGEHFNKTEYPHYKYQERYLLSKGVKRDQVIGRLMTSNTVEDVSKVLIFCEEKTISEVTVVTSDFHVPRVKQLFDLKMNKRSISVRFEGSVTECSRLVMADLMAHEAKSIRGGLV